MRYLDIMTFIFPGLSCQFLLASQGGFYAIKCVVFEGDPNLLPLFRNVFICFMSVYGSLYAIWFSCSDSVAALSVLGKDIIEWNFLLTNAIRKECRWFAVVSMA